MTRNAKNFRDPDYKLYSPNPCSNYQGPYIIVDSAPTEQHYNVTTAIVFGAEMPLLLRLLSDSRAATRVEQKPKLKIATSQLRRLI